MAKTLKPYELKAACPHCRYQMEVHSAISEEGAEPVAGDYTMCVGCASPLMFDSPTAIRALREPELAELPPEIRRLSSFVASYNARSGRTPSA
jgi:hypothetical protein